jgi:hypothetical protein
MSSGLTVARSGDGSPAGAADGAASAGGALSELVDGLAAPVVPPAPLAPAGAAAAAGGFFFSGLSAGPAATLAAASNEDSTTNVDVARMR